MTPDHIQVIIDSLDYRYEKIQQSEFANEMKPELKRIEEAIAYTKQHPSILKSLRDVIDCDTSDEARVYNVRAILNKI